MAEMQVTGEVEDEYAISLEFTADLGRSRIRNSRHAFHAVRATRAGRVGAKRPGDV
jgi:hypothetical protein